MRICRRTGRPDVSSQAGRRQPKVPPTALFVGAQHAVPGATQPTKATLWPAAVRYLALRLASDFHHSELATGPPLRQRKRSKLYNFTAFLTETGLQIEVIENK
jgi:hypothetical protein